MYIGQVSAHTGASVKAIRLYESMGLLQHVHRQGRYRVYGDRHVRLVRLIMQAKKLGFTLSELKHFVERSQDVGPWSCILSMIQHKQTQVEQQIHSLKKQQQALANYANAVQQCLAEDENCDIAL